MYPLLPALSLLLASPTASGSAPHVLVIGIDGARADAVRAANTPNLDGLIATGAVSWNAVAGGAPDPSDPAQQQTSSGPGWSSLLTGVWADAHQVYSNGDFASGNFATYPHFFARVRAAQPGAYLSSIVQWHPINQSLLDPFPGLASFTQEVADSGQAVENAVVAHLASADPDALFVHFDDVDHAGHGSGFSPFNPQYLQAIEETDGHIGAILAALEARPGYALEDWLILVTTDHGGNGSSHGGQSPTERTIWLVASGGGAAVVELAPGPGHTAVARTALHHLGVAVDPGWGLVDEEPFGLERDVASYPVPVDAAQQRSLGEQLGWFAGADASGHDVYFGTDPVPGPGELQGQQSETSFDPGALAPATTYYWRIDTVTSQGTVVGDVWSFTTRGALSGELVVHLDFEGDALDASGSGNDGTLAGDPDFVAGAFGAGLRLDGKGDHLSLGDPQDLRFGPNADFTVAFWIRSDGWSSDPVLLANKNWASGANRGWLLAGDPDGESWQWNYKGGAAERLDLDQGGKIADGSWHHLAVTHDRDGDATFYQDGVAVASGPIVGRGGLNTGLATALGQDGTLVYGQELAGTFDDVGIWRRVLGPSEIADLVTTGVRPALGTSYCDPAVPNSTGASARISVIGSANVADDDLTLTAVALPTQPNIGYFIMGTGMNTFVPPGSAGPICVTPGLRRFLPPVENATELEGGFTRSIGTTGPVSGNITAGSTWNFQAWHRDSAAGTSNLTNAVSVTFL